MKEKLKEQTVSDVMNKILFKLSNNLDNSSTKATLARLRNSIGRDIGQTVYIWDEVFSELPMEFLSKDGMLTKEEKAILNALQLYALHQQGTVKSVHTDYKKLKDMEENMDDKDKKYYSSNIGESFSKMRMVLEDTTSVDKRFNAMITAQSFEEIMTHLRHLVKIFKSKSEETIDYAKLANDLFFYQIGRKENVKLDWGQSYYWIEKKEEEENNEK